PDGLGVEDPPRAERGPVLLAEDEVVGHGEGEDQALDPAVFRDVRHAASARALRIVVGDVRAADHDRAGCRLAQAEYALGLLALAIATDAGDAQDLAGIDSEVDALE